MSFSSSLSPQFPPHPFRLCSPRVHGRPLSFIRSTGRCCSLHGINSVLGHRRSRINGNEAPEPARALLERLFAQTQKLEEQMSGSSHPLHDAFHSEFNFESLESDLMAALEALRKKEEDLQEAERLVMLEHAELNRAREELELRGTEIATASCKHEKLEDELSQANLKLVSEGRHIEDLKLRLKERDQEIAEAKSFLSSKENEINQTRDELARKIDEAAMIEAQLKSKSELLDEANKVVKRQDIEIRQLRKALLGKQQELEESISLQQLEEEKVRIAESKLEKRTMEWLVAQEELKKLGEEASRHIGESKETMEDFLRVKRLLSDVRSELVSSQKSLIFSRHKMEERELVLEKQLLELEEQKTTLMSYMHSLRNAQIEVESEKARIKVAEARNNELEFDLSLKKDLMEGIEEELQNEKSSLQEAMGELSSLQNELKKKNDEFQETNNLLMAKEKELVEAKMEIQNLKSKHESLQLVLKERDAELFTARNKLSEINSEIGELRMLSNSKEDQLIQATNMLKEKEGIAQVMQLELDGTKLKASEAETVIERILDLTNELVYPSSLMGEIGSFQMQLLENPMKDHRRQKNQLEIELKLTKESLQTKEMELLAIQKELKIKDEEVKIVVCKLEEKERELKELREKTLKDTDDLKNLEELAIEKLQLEAAQLELKAATSALQKLVEMSGHLLTKDGMSIAGDQELKIIADGEECLAEVKSEVARLASLTERLVKEAGALSPI